MLQTVATFSKTRTRVYRTFAYSSNFKVQAKEMCVWPGPPPESHVLMWPLVTNNCPPLSYTVIELLERSVQLM